MATRIERLTSIRDNLLQLIDEQTAAWIIAGCPPSFSVDGESYDWGGWLQGKTDALKTLDELIQQAKPFYLRSRHRG